MRSEDIAWAAGLFEGEGCFYIHRRPEQTMVGVTLSSTDEDVLAKFAEVMGVGRVRLTAADPRGNRKRIYHWRVQDVEGVRIAIGILLPWLCERRSHKALEVLEAAEAIGVHPKHRTHCPHGHSYTEENTLWCRDGGRRYRRCRECNRTYYKRNRQRRTASV